MARRTRRQAEPPDDLFGYLQGRRRGLRPTKPAEPPIVVTDNWPIFVPVTDHEVRIVEAFFADVLDELFGHIP